MSNITRRCCLPLNSHHITDELECVLVWFFGMHTHRFYAETCGLKFSMYVCVCFSCSSNGRIHKHAGCCIFFFFRWLHMRVAERGWRKRITKLLGCIVRILSAPLRLVRFIYYKFSMVVHNSSLKVHTHIHYVSWNIQRRVPILSLLYMEIFSLL